LNGNALQSIDGSIRVASIDTDDTKRDGSLRSDAYLDEEAYPLIVFHSTQIVTGVEPSIIGKLKLKDQEREIRIPYTYRISDSGTKCFITLSTSILRSHFQLDFGPMDALVGDEVRVELEVVGMVVD